MGKLKNLKKLEKLKPTAFLVENLAVKHLALTSLTSLTSITSELAKVQLLDYRI